MTLLLTISGQIMGGKNHIQITRTGHRYPNKSWAAWRDQAVMQVRTQLRKIKGFEPFDTPVNVDFRYVAGDKRRRDMPAIIDSVWHVLEKAGVVTDDTLLWITSSERSYSKDFPYVTLYLDSHQYEADQ